MANNIEKSQNILFLGMENCDYLTVFWNSSDIPIFPQMHDFVEY